MFQGLRNIDQIQQQLKERVDFLAGKLMETDRRLDQLNATIDRLISALSENTQQLKKR